MVYKGSRSGSHRNSGLRRSKPSLDPVEQGVTLRRARMQLVKAKKLRREVNEIFDAIERENEKNYQDIKRLGVAVDVLAMTFTGLAKVIKKGIQALGKTGQELIKANRELLREVAEQHVDLGLKIFDEHTGTHLGTVKKVVKKDRWAVIAMAVGGEIGEWLLNCQNPSFLAQKYTGVYPDTIHGELRAKTKRQRAQALMRANRRIGKMETAIFILSGRDRMA